MHTWLSPESAPSTFACAVSSTELNATARSFASRRNAPTSSSGILASCSPTPATGSSVHRGIAVNPPAKSTLRQNSRLPSVVVNALRRLRLPISHLLRRVSTPPRVGRNLLPLHEERVGAQQ